VLVGDRRQPIGIFSQTLTRLWRDRQADRRGRCVAVRPGRPGAPCRARRRPRPAGMAPTGRGLG